MKTRHVIAIGLLSITAIGLLAYGLHKSNKKPPLQTKATDYFETYNNETDWKIKGSYTTPEVDDYFRETIEYEITRQNTAIQVGIYPTKIQAFDDTEGEIYDITIQNNEIQNNVYTFFNNKTISNIRITPAVEIDTAYIGDNPANGIAGYTQDFEVRIYYTDNTNNYLYKTIALTPNYKPAPADYYYYPAYNIFINPALLITTVENSWAKGYNTAESFANPIDIRSIMLQVLTMPFTFINNAFDVTLWEGTQYAFNIKNFILGIIAILAILFIIRLFTSGLSIIGNYTANINKEATMKSQNRRSKQAWKSQKIAQKGAKEANKE